MKVLSIGLDRSSLDPASAAGRRVALYRGMVERYEVVVPAGAGLKPLRLWSLYRRAAGLLGADRFDVITVQDVYFIALAARRLARRFGASFEVQVHGFEHYRGLRRKIARRTIRSADHIRVVSERLKRQIVADFGVSADRITVAPVFSDRSMMAITSADRLAKKAGEPIRFLFVGRLVQVKNTPLLLNAFSDVAAEVPIQLTIVGDGPERTRLEAMARRLNISDKVEFAGRQDAVAPYYDRADVFVLPSDAEGWGLVAVEAAQHGVPIVMTDVGLAGEVIRDGQSGLVVPQGDRAALAQALKRLAQSPEDRARLGAAARTAVMSLPSLEETLRRIRAGWESAVSARRA